jgi:hypothetical protein
MARGAGVERDIPHIRALPSVFTLTLALAAALPGRWTAAASALLVILPSAGRFRVSYGARRKDWA